MWPLTTGNATATWGRIDWDVGQSNEADFTLEAANASIQHLLSQGIDPHAVLVGNLGDEIHLLRPEQRIPLNETDAAFHAWATAELLHANLTAAAITAVARHTGFPWYASSCFGGNRACVVDAVLPAASALLHLRRKIARRDESPRQSAPGERGRLPPMLPASYLACLLYTSPSPRDKRQSRMPSSA